MSDILQLINEEIKGGKAYLVINTNEQIDDAAFRTISHAKPVFMPSVTMSEVDGHQRFSYDILSDGFEPLSALGNDITAENFVKIVNDIISVATQGEDYFLLLSNFLIEKDFIYVNPKTFQVRLIYLFFERNVYSEKEISSNVYKLARDLSRVYSSASVSSSWQDVISIMWAMSEDVSIYDMKEQFSGISVKSSSPVARYEQSMVYSLPQSKPQNAPVLNNQVAANIQQPQINKGLPVPPASAVEKKGIVQRLFGTGAKKEKPPKAVKEKVKKERSKESKYPSLETPGGGLFSGNKPGSPLPQLASPEKIEKPKKEPKAKKIKTPELVKVAPEAIPDAGVTVLDDMNATELDPIFSAVRFATLTDASNPSVKIPINKPAFVIGRNRAVVDLCFDSEIDRSVSRTHAQIFNTNGQYALTTISTTANIFTYLNGQPIAYGQTVVLTSGDSIRVGKRDLLFEI